MKTTLFAILALAIISCNKENSNKMSEDQLLKAVPSATVNGKEITFDMSKSTGAITQYGFQLEESTPTQSPVVYSPGSSHKGSDFVSIKATVQKSGTYTFRLTVYDVSGEDHTNFNVEVK